MRHNVVKEKVLKGEPAIGAAMNLPSPELMEICGIVGFEWSMIDAEHAPIDPAMCQALCRAAEVRGVVPMIRVPVLDPVVIMTYLQTGPLGVGIPHIKTREDAEAAVNFTRYYPDGRRGCDLGQRSSEYNITELPEEYYARANRELMVVIWIEDYEGFQNLDEILKVPGVDAVNFGAGDLALSMGLPGGGEHGFASDPEVLAVMAEGLKKVLDAGKVFMAEPVSTAMAQQAIDDGALLINTAVRGMFTNAARDYLRAVRGA